jgi:iron uptake system component EfeO
MRIHAIPPFTTLSLVVVVSAVVGCATLLVGCAETDDSADAAAETVDAVKRIVATDLEALHAAAVALQAAAPAPDADGWNATDDAAAVDEMRRHWSDARNAYERIEGAIAVLFPDLDASTDERYDGFLAEGPDDDLFDDEGVTGVHGIERILWADAHPASTIAFESAIPGYTAAAYPADAAQATAFRDALLQRLVDDIALMQTSFEPLALDAAAAYGGVLGSMSEQIEKIELAATGEDESRYAQHTLADMRANLEGGRLIFAAFEPWLEEENGDAVIADVHARFDAVQAAYDALPGTALPAIPEGWNPDAPDADDLATPYGTLWSLLVDEVDPEQQDRMVSRMSEAADLLDIPVLP